MLMEVESADIRSTLSVVFEIARLSIHRLDAISGSGAPGC